MERWPRPRHTVVGMEEATARRLFAQARVGRLATVTPGGEPHLVPVTFVLVDDTVWTAVDGKPKRTRRLQRLRNIAANPRASVLVDHYAEDWSQLWWVRADGSARVPAAGDEVAPALGALAAKYEVYRTDPPGGPFIAIDVHRWRWWAASGPGPSADDGPSR